MASLPTGTVTFLFTDIEGSTRLLQELGDQYAYALEELRRLLRAALKEQGGQEVDSQGDAFFFAFERAKDAVAAAVAAQQAIRRAPWAGGATIRVRMGVHTGEPLKAGASYVGMDVHRAARICSAGHGGQILLSDTTGALVVRELPEGVALRDLGEHRLKDLTHAQRVFQVVAADLPDHFPPVRSLGALPNNLPNQLTSFIGREREKREVKHLLETTRILTLTGSGGAGKTRLALQVAAELLEEYPGGVWLVELAALFDPTLIPNAIASALNVPEQRGLPLTNTLVDFLRSKSLLLLVDNCEHLLPACAGLGDKLLRSCPTLRMLTTSREPLGIPGEVIWRVPSLSFPDSRSLPSLEQLSEYEAVRLFVERAVSHEPGFMVSSDNVRPVVQVCQRLGGIPLAIELAAARVKVLAVEQIATRLDDRFRLLTGGGRTVLPRHQTLRATMDWSYDLLSENERTVLQRLSVFSGGWTLEAAESVCAGEKVKTPDILDLLTQLVDKSMVGVSRTDGDTRYGLLETVRQYAYEKFEEAGGGGDLRRRHCRWYLRLAEEAGLRWGGSAMPVWIERLEREHDNFRGALEWSGSEAGDHEFGLQLAIALVRFWEMRGYFTEGRRWLESLIARSESVPPLLKAAALNAAGILAYRQGSYPRVSELCSKALALCEAHGDRRGAGRALHFLAHVMQAQGDYAVATVMMERSVALHRAGGEAADLANSVDCLGEIARSAGDDARARVYTEEALALYRDLGHVRGQAHALHNLAYLRLHEGDAAEARAFFRESLVLAKQLGTIRDQVFAIVGLACASLVNRETSWVTRILGAAEAVLSTIGMQLEPAEDAEFRRAAETMRAQLDPAAFGTAWAEGRMMTLEEAIKYALAAEAN